MSQYELDQYLDQLDREYEDYLEGQEIKRDEEAIEKAIQEAKKMSQKKPFVAWEKSMLNPDNWTDEMREDVGLLPRDEEAIEKAVKEAEKMAQKKNDHAEIVVKKENNISLGQMMFSNPAQMVAQAKIVAATLKDVITSQKLYVEIKGRNYVMVEGWSTLGAMLGVVPRTVSVEEIQEGIFEATVELVNTTTGMIVGQGIAECGADKPWNTRDRYAKKSMAITRATGKAFRLSYSWIIKLAGYEGTPAEEMPR